MNEILQQIGDLGLVPVVKINKAENAVPLAQALLDGGLPVAEITFRTAAAEEAIKSICSTFSDILVGAGTVLNVEQAEKAVNAGAKFIVTPGFSPGVVKYCLDAGVPVTPGIATPTEIQMALDMDVNILKFFPAEAFGGMKTLKSMSAPYGMVKFIPTGGINADNLVDYIMFPKVHACGGSWMVKDTLIKDGKFDEITRLTREAIDNILGFQLGHVGINSPDADASIRITKQIASVFNLPVKEGNSSNFAGKGFEVTKKKGLGANGHVAVTTNSLTRAVAFLERKGIAIDMNTAKKDSSGTFVAVYLKEEFGGFAVHLLQKK